MGEIIHFPNAVQKSRGAASLEPTVVRVDNSVTSQMHLGPWEFSCQKCKAKTSFEPKNMIFRSVDFYCASCGALHKVTNPAFTLNTPKK